MRIVMTSLAVLTLVACDRPADTTPDTNVAVDNMTADANAMVAPASFQLNETTWEFTREGKATVETVDASGNYVAWSGDEHLDHGTSAMVDGKACFTSAMNDDGPVCWTTQPTEIGDSMEAVSDKGETLTVTRVAYTPVPDNVKP